MRLEKLAKYQLAIYFFLAFAITWVAQITTYLYADSQDIKITNEENLFHIGDLLSGNLAPGFVPYLLLFSFAFGPTVAGVIVTALFKGKAGLANLWERLTKVRIPVRWILLIFTIPLVWNLIALGIGFAANGFQPIDFDFLVPLTLAVPLFLYMFIFTGLAEEIGWRGYALPELQSKYTAEKSSWILGIFWGLWHIPSVMLVQHLQGELTPPAAISLLFGLTLGIVGWTIVTTWIYNNTKSLFWIVMLHALSNTFQSYLILSSNNEPAMAVWTLIPWVFAIFLLKKYGGETLLVKSKQ